MAEIDLAAAINDATEKYDALIDNLWAENGEGTFRMSPEDFVQAVNDSGLYEVGGADNTDNVSIYIGEVVEPETDEYAEQVYHPTVIEIGEVPAEYENNNEDFADDDGNARITIWDDRLSDLEYGVHVAAYDNAVDTGMNLSNENVESVTEYNIHGDTDERQIDIVRTEGSDTTFTVDQDRGTMRGEYTQISDDLHLTEERQAIPAADIDQIKDENPDAVTSHDLELSKDEDGNTTVSIDGNEMFTESGEVNVDDLVAFLEDNNDAISVEIDRGDTFESYDDFKEGTENRSEWLEYLDDHADAAAYIDSHMDEFDKPQEEWTPQDLMQAIDDVESSGVLHDVDSETPSDDDESTNDYEEKLDDIKDAVLDGMSSVLDGTIGGFEKDAETAMEKDSDKATEEKEQQADNESGRDGISAEDSEDEADDDKDQIEDDDDYGSDGDWND